MVHDSFEKEGIRYNLENQRKRKELPFYLTKSAFYPLPAFVICLAVLLKKISLGALPAQKLGDMLFFYFLMFGIYWILCIPAVVDFVKMCFENKIGFGLKGRMMKTPSAQESSCAIIFLKFLFLLSMYLTVYTLLFK